MRTCLWCEESITEEEARRWPFPAGLGYHNECLIRIVLGSKPGAGPEDPPGLSRRAAARAAAARLTRGRDP